MAPIHDDDPANAPAKSVSDAIVEAAAELEGVDPTAFDECLYDVVDPDALETLVRGSGALERLEFTFRGYRVVVDGEGDVEVADLPDR